MLNDTLKDKLTTLYQRINKGDLSNGGELSQQMFFSMIDVIINEENLASIQKITDLERNLTELRTEKDLLFLDKIELAAKISELNIKKSDE